MEPNIFVTGYEEVSEEISSICNDLYLLQRRIGDVACKMASITPRVEIRKAPVKEEKDGRKAGRHD